MATHGPQTLETPEPAGGQPRGAKLVEYDRFIEEQLRKTRSQVRGVDIAAALMVLVAGSLAYFFAAAMLDHWIWRGGLATWARWLLLAGYVAAAGWWVVTQIVPLLVRKINPLYAAQTIERSRPSIKNALVNFLLFREDPAAVHRRVLEAIEEQAATNLAGVPVEAAVDRSRLVKLGYVLVALVALAAVYTLVSPKNLLQTVGRVVMPWANIAPPTRATIDELEPGDVVAFRGEQVMVRARVQGLRAGERVLLFYTSSDQQVVDRPVEMTLPAGEYRHVSALPGSAAGLQQSLTYRIEAGDARTREYTLEMASAPTILVRAVEYKYPQYTGLVPQRVEHQGDLKAIEGTQVTLEAAANEPIASAYVDFDCNDTLDLPLRGEDTQAKATFRLVLDRERQRPEHASYQLIFKNAAGQTNPQPIRHQIEVTRDLPPEVQFVAPSREEIELPADAAVDLEVVALDPDFALSSVRLRAHHGERSLMDEPLLDETWRGQFTKKYRFVPTKFKLKAGDVVEYKAEAIDNKTPQPNRTETSLRKIRITAPRGTAGGEDQVAQRDQRGDGDPSDSAAPGRGGEDARPRQDGDEKQDTGGESGGESDGAAGEDGTRQESGGAAGSDDSSPAESQGGKQNQSGSGAQGSSGEGSQEGSDVSQSGHEAGGEQQGGQSGSGDGGSGERGSGERGADRQSQRGAGQSSEDASGQAGDDGDGGESSRGQSGGRDSGGQSRERQSVPSDGTNDGDAFERILEHRDEQSKSDDAGQQQRDGEQPPAGKASDSGDKQAAREQAGGQPGERDSKSNERGASEPQDARDGQDGPSQDDGSAGNSSDERAGDGKTPAGEKPSGADRQSPGKDNGGEQGQRGQRGQQGEQGQRGEQKQGQTPGDREAREQSGEAAGDDQQSDTDAEGKQGEGAEPGEQPSPSDAKQQQGQGGEQGQKSGQRDAQTDGQAGQSQPEAARGGQQQGEKSDQQRPDARGGEPEQQRGESGAGQKSQDQQGSPSPQDTNQPRDKSAEQGEQARQSPREGQEQSPSTSKTESDAQGDEDGDRSGGGKRGGGQKANQSGTGGAGQNTAADEGAGQSDQPGDGETGERAGDDAASDSPTGQSGQQPGSGSRTRPAGEQQPQPGEEGGDSASGDESGQPSDGERPGTGGGAAGGDAASDRPAGAGDAPEEPWKPGVDAADEANLEYTRKATDLALEHLKHELGKEQPDPALLDRLGWTREQADAFVKRWEAMRAGADTPNQRGAAGRRELDDTLRSLGLRPRGATVSGSPERKDRAAGYRESQRTTPPPEYSEAFKAYTQGTARGGK